MTEQEISFFDQIRKLQQSIRFVDKKIVLSI
jgi:hypothetical protein